MPDPIISIPWTDDSLTVLDFNKMKVNGELVTDILAERDHLRARVASLEETGRLNAEEYIKAQAETTRWAARYGVEKGLREQAEARVAELEARIAGAKEALDSAIASHTKNDLDGWELGVVLTRLNLPYPTTRIPKWIPGA